MRDIVWCGGDCCSVLWTWEGGGGGGETRGEEGLWGIFGGRGGRLGEYGEGRWVTRALWWFGGLVVVDE